jgi:uncharacterized protein YjiS (DUF1127 family)
MNQMTSNTIAFKSAEPVNGHDPVTSGVFARLAARVRQYLAVRRTLRALDRLSQEQLKDIGYRRFPDTWSKYERLP